MKNSFFNTAASAYLAGSTRLIQYFPSAKLKGLLGAATASSIGLGVSKLLENEIGLQKRTPLYLLLKVALVGTVGIRWTSWAAKKFGSEAKILSRDIHKFQGATIGVILGAHSSRYILPKISREVNPEQLESDLNWIKAVPLARWEIKPSVLQFDIDEILSVLGDEMILGKEEFKPEISTLFNIDGREVAVDNGKESVELIQGYADASSGQRGAAKWYLNKILGYMLLKKRAYILDQRSNDEKAADFEKLKDLFELVASQVVDAHRGCIDQTLSQLQNLALTILEDFGLSEVDRVFALEMMKYRTALIKEGVSLTGEYHAADLEVDVARSIFASLRVPRPRSLKNGAAYKMIYNPNNFFRARHHFFKQYKPVEYLESRLEAYTLRKAFNGMSEWYQKNIFKDATEENEDKYKELLGCDFLIDFERKPEAVLYYLYKEGIITF